MQRFVPTGDSGSWHRDRDRGTQPKEKGAGSALCAEPAPSLCSCYLGRVARCTRHSPAWFYRLGGLAAAEQEARACERGTNEPHEANAVPAGLRELTGSGVRHLQDHLIAFATHLDLSAAGADRRNLIFLSLLIH